MLLFVINIEYILLVVLIAKWIGHADKKLDCVMPDML